MWKARISSRSSRIRTISLAWISMSTAWPGRTAVRLVDQHPGVREDEPLARCTGGEQHRGGRRGLADAEGLHVGLDVLHRVVDREQTRDLAAGRVDVHDDVFVRVLGLEDEQLRDQRGCATLSSTGVPRKMMRSLQRVASTDPVRIAAAWRVLDESRDRERVRCGYSRLGLLACLRVLSCSSGGRSSWLS